MQSYRELKNRFVVPSLAALVGRSFCLCLMVLLGTLQVRADVTGSILGYVRDKSGAVLPNATVTAIQTTTGYTRTATSDGSGQYSHSGFASWNLQPHRPDAGFQQGVIDKINLNVNDALQL